MCKRGDIYYVDFGEKDGSKQGGVRPALVVSNNKANKHSPVVTVVPLSARVWKKKYLPTHVQIPKGSGLNKPSMALYKSMSSFSSIPDFISHKAMWRESFSTIILFS